MKRREWAIAMVVGLALLALAALFMLMNRLAAAPGGAIADQSTVAATTALPTAAPPASSPIPSRTPTQTATSDMGVPDGPVAASVDGAVITVAEWRLAVLVDGMMSRLTGQPLPAAEETLQRLINEVLVIRAASLDTAPLPLSEAEAHIQRTQTQFAISDGQLAAALASSGLLRQDLVRRIARLILVERGMEVLATRYADLDAWLTQARADSAIVVSSDIPPEPVAVAEPPTATPAATATEPPTPLPTQAAFGAAPPNTAPDFNLIGLDGEMHPLGRLRGQPVVLNFWATWCPPCRTELPALQAAHNRYAARVSVIGIAVRETADQVAPVATEYGLTYPILLDLDGAVTEGHYAIHALPTTLIIDADGIVSVRHIGPLSDADIDRYLAPLIKTEPVQAPPISEAGPEAGLPLAPDFTLDSADGTPVTLSDYRDKSAVVLVFYRGQT